MMEFAEKNRKDAIIKIIGVGGGGGNAVNSMIDMGIEGVEFIVANTDSMDLEKSKAKIKLLLGENITQGQGTGAVPEKGREAALESIDDIREALHGANMVFIAAGLGGGTGTGAAPVIASVAKEMDILTMAIVTRPFEFEGLARQQNYEEGIQRLRENVDTFIVIPNEKLTDIYGDLFFLDAFQKADSVLTDAASSLNDIIRRCGYINVDFSDVKTVMKNMGYCMMGMGTAEGENRAVQATQEAIANPLLNEISLEGCKALLINITCGRDMKMSELNEVSKVVTNQTGKTSTVIMGLVLDEEMTDQLSVTIIATGLNDTDDEMTEFPEIHTKVDTDFKSEQLEIALDRIRKSDVTDPEMASEPHSFEGEKILTDDKSGLPSFLRKFTD